MEAKEIPVGGDGLGVAVATGSTCGTSTIQATR